MSSKEKKKFSDNSVDVSPLNESAQKTDVFIVDRLSRNDTCLTELSCGHTAIAPVAVGEKCPKCEATVQKSPYKRNIVIIAILIFLLVINIVLTYTLLRTVSLHDVVGDAFDEVQESQTAQLAEFESLSYHPKGYTWLASTIDGRWPAYSASQFGFGASGTQVFRNDEGEPLFYISTSNEMDGCIAVAMADGDGKATLYAIDNRRSVG